MRDLFLTLASLAFLTSCDLNPGGSSGQGGSSSGQSGTGGDAANGGAGAGAGGSDAGAGGSEGGAAGNAGSDVGGFGGEAGTDAGGNGGRGGSGSGGCAATGGSDAGAGGSDAGAGGSDAGAGGSDAGAGGEGGASTAPRQIGVGWNHACALFEDGSVKCWGSSFYSELGLGDVTSRGDEPNEMGSALPAVPLGTRRTVKELSVGYNHNCVILDDGSVKCWGRNDVGQLGLGDVVNRGGAPGEMGDALPEISLGAGRTATALAAGGDYTCALLDNNSVKCWGSNYNGQLGLGDTANRGDAPGEMGDALNEISFGTGRTVKMLAAGFDHSCVLLQDDTVKCWGGNDQGQLGLGDTAPRGQATGEMGDALPAVSLGTGRTAKALSLGFHSCALLDDSSVKCWGSNIKGQLGLGDNQNRGAASGQMGDALPTVSLGSGRTAKGITAGLDHTCARLDDNTAKCWGNNNSGQLGLGDIVFRGRWPNQMGDALPAVQLGARAAVDAIDVGGNFSCALLSNQSVKCWGFNLWGQLGLGDAVNRGDGPGEMGNALPAVKL